MKTSICAPIVAMLALAAPYAAAGTVSVPGFTLAETWTGDEGKLRLLSNEDGAARIAIAGYNGFEIVGDRDPYSLLRQVALAGTVQPGYRIDSMTWSGTLYGRTEVSHDPVCAGCTLMRYYEGTAWNGADIWWDLGQAGATLQLPRAGASGWQGDQPFSVTYNSKLAGTFELELNVTLLAYAIGDYMELYRDGEYWLDYYTQAYALGGMRDVVLTVQVSAVPEPATYAMLLAGLGMAGWTSRRRQSVA